MHPGDPMSPPALNDMRRAVLDGTPYTKESFAQAVRTMVGARIAASASPTKAKGKSKELPITSLDNLL